MQDDTVYDSHPGGGFGDGTTSGTTGRDPLHNTETFDDKELPVSDTAQKEALEQYRPKVDEQPRTNSSEHEDVSGLLPHQRTEQVPDTGVAHFVHVEGMPVSPATEQAAAQLAQDNEISALSDLNGDEQTKSDL